MTKVKICGLSTQAAVEQAVSSGADYIGFVFAKSKRQVSLQTAQQLAQSIPSPIKKVGVFVSPTLEELQTAITSVPLDMVQIHGDFEEALLELLPVPSIRAIQMTKTDHHLVTKADYLLLDAPVAGSGETFDWSLLAYQILEKPYFLAGGLTPDNVSLAKSHLSPYALDVSSGVETNGEKDNDKIARFIERAKYEL